MKTQDPQRDLIKLLQLAYSGELAAAHAYRGHARSVRDPLEKEEIQAIEREEIVHRACVGEMLSGLGASPSRARERCMAVVGRTIGLLCRVGGWFVPMYGAGRLESKNVKEYEDAARLAWMAGHPGLVEDLLHMAEVEWDHEAYFKRKASEHWMRRIFPAWKSPPPRNEIRTSFARFRESGASPAASPDFCCVPARRPNP